MQVFNVWRVKLPREVWSQHYVLARVPIKVLGAIFLMSLGPPGLGFLPQVVVFYSFANDLYDILNKNKIK